MKAQFRTPNLEKGKDLFLGCIGDLTVFVDYDAVNHAQVEVLLPLVMKALNSIDEEDIDKALKKLETL